jgi:hypothetical protein
MAFLTSASKASGEKINSFHTNKKSVVPAPNHKKPCRAAAPQSFSLFYKPTFLVRRQGISDGCAVRSKRLV